MTTPRPTRPSEPPVCATVFVGLGANLGDARATLRDALAALQALAQPGSFAASSLYGSAPVDSSGPDYVNAVARLDTSLAPHALLDALQAIEQRFGRERPYRNAPRTLDLDILDYDRRVESGPPQLPHPRINSRAFVLIPLRDVAPDWRDPVSGKGVDDLIEALPRADRDAVRISA